MFFSLDISLKYNFLCLLKLNRCIIIGMASAVSPYKYSGRRKIICIGWMFYKTWKSLKTTLPGLADSGRLIISIYSTITIFSILSPSRISSIISTPSTTLPKQVWLRSKCAVFSLEWQTKNCDPPVLRPACAIESTPLS